MFAQPKVLLLSSDETESNALERVLSEYVNLQNAGNLSELENMLPDGGYDAVFCGRSFQEGAWNDALEEVQQRCPDLPVIIFSQTGDEQEWSEVIEAGAFDLLVAPYLNSTVLPVLEQAVVSFEARRRHNVTLNPVKAVS